MRLLYQETQESIVFGESFDYGMSHSLPLMSTSCCGKIPGQQTKSYTAKASQPDKQKRPRTDHEPYWRRL